MEKSEKETSLDFLKRGYIGCDVKSSNINSAFQGSIKDFYLNDKDEIIVIMIDEKDAENHTLWDDIKNLEFENSSQKDILVIDIDKEDKNNNVLDSKKHSIEVDAVEDENYFKNEIISEYIKSFMLIGYGIRLDDVTIEVDTFAHSYEIWLGEKNDYMITVHFNGDLLSQ